MACQCGYFLYRLLRWMRGHCGKLFVSSRQLSIVCIGCPKNTLGFVAIVSAHVCTISLHHTTPTYTCNVIDLSLMFCYDNAVVIM